MTNVCLRHQRIIVIPFPHSSGRGGGAYVFMTNVSTYILITYTYIKWTLLGIVTSESVHNIFQDGFWLILDT